jgi:hypothetical protein
MIKEVWNEKNMVYQEKFNSHPYLKLLLQVLLLLSLIIRYKPSIFYPQL